MRKPYVVIADIGGGAADVLDRTTGQRLGRVLQDFHGRWEAVDTCGRHLMWWRYRSDATDFIWASQR